MSNMIHMNDDENVQKRILVGMSGGVDSSAAVLILKEQGYQVKGMILRMHDEGMSVEDLSNGKLPHSIWHAREAARRMRLDFTIRDVREQFRQDVIGLFVKGCAACTNPDPCVHCCAVFLLPQLFQAADQLGCTHVATGHYAITGYDAQRKRYVIRKGKDVQHDESHTLYRLSQEQLARLITPLGTYEKDDARRIAQKARLKNALTPQSPAICFIPDRDYQKFLEGKGLADVPESAGDPMDQEPCSATETVVSGICCSGTESLPAGEMAVRARIRSPFNETDAVAHITEDGDLKVQLGQPLKAAVPGQSIVLYDGDVVAMGGIIKECHVRGTDR